MNDELYEKIYSEGTQDGYQAGLRYAVQELRLLKTEYDNCKRDYDTGAYNALERAIDKLDNELNT